MVLTKTIAFHSYKGGTGKTTIATNLSTILALKGYNVLLIDLDVYAPSLHVYFDFRPDKWLNNYLLDNSDLSETIYDCFRIIKSIYHDSLLNYNKGIFDIIFSNPSKEVITSLDLKDKISSKSQMLNKMLNLRGEGSSELPYDYIILDTSPGIRYWSINSLAISDTILLSLKMDNIDIQGTKQMAIDVYKSFLDFGTKAYLLLNRTAGYCKPPVQGQNLLIKDGKIEFNILEQYETTANLERYLNMEMVLSLPCYCDIQFERQEFLTVLKTPDHPFTEKINQLADKIISN